MMYHGKLMPAMVSVMPGKPKAAWDRLEKIIGRNCRMRYLKTVTRLDTMTKRPPSRIHVAAEGCFSANEFQKFIACS